MYPPVKSDSSERSPAVESAFAWATKQREGFLSHFGLREPPFGVTPDPSFLFLSAKHREAIQAMVHSIEANLGFTVLLGEPGTGKTSLLFHLLNQYQQRARTAFVFQTQCQPSDLLRYIASELELPWQDRDEVALHHRLNEMLVREGRGGRRVLIMIDEAQNLDEQSLEAVRLLSDFETPAAKLLHVILAGSAGLGETLRRPDISQLAQRINTVCRLGPLSAGEVQKYVTHRLAVAGSKDEIFAEDALGQLAQKSRGVPRRLNSICYRALTLAFDKGERCVSAQMVQQAAHDLDLADPKPSARTSLTPFTPARRSARVLDFSAPAASEAAPLPSPEPPGEPDLLSRLAEALARDAERETELHPTLERNEPSTVTATEVESATSGLPANIDVPVLVSSEASGATAAQAAPVPAVKDDRPFSPLPNQVVTPQPWKREPSGKISAKAPRERPAPQIRVRVAGRKNQRATIAVLMLLLLGLGIWAGRYELRAREAAVTAAPVKGTAPETVSGDSAPVTSEPAAPAGAEKPASTVVANGAASSETKPSSTNQAAVGSAKPHAPAPVIWSVAETQHGSKIGRTAASKAGDAAAPANIVGVGGNSPLAGLSLVSVPTGSPRLDAATAGNDAGTASGASTLQPVKVVQPVYPRVAKMMHIEGDVMLELEIGAKGNVQKARAISGSPVLREAAEDAAKQWKYPPSRDKAPLVTQVLINFRLKP
jgi:general secretion pathway protein A